MQYKQLGSRGPVVSTIGFGAWAIGGMHWGKTDDEASIRALHTAIDHGVTLIDTADVYGFGHSEELIARVIRERGKENLVIATKAGSDFYSPDPADDDGYGAISPNYSKEYLIGAAEKSLKRLQVDALDILQLHSPELGLLERDEPWLALEKLKRDGKIKHAGLSIKSFEESIQAPLLDVHHDILDCIQVRYNLLEREAEEILFPKALEHGIGVIVRIPLLFGLLTGKFDRNSKFGEDDHRRMNLSAEKLDGYLNRFEQHQKLFDRYPDQSKTRVSLRFAITHPACQTAIPGAKTSAQVQENCSSADLDPVEL
jgi:aryl-alcohol dehydrogenase-like predicted oxidoreductase